MLSIGYGNLVAEDKIVAVLAPESAPIKRLIHEAKEQGMLIDATYGRKTRSVLVMNSGHVILTAATAETLNSKMQ
jgi:regulator of extracellular matrix RemA (YlzA/DUF370 family)